MSKSSVVQWKKLCTNCSGSNFHAGIKVSLKPELDAHPITNIITYTTQSQHACVWICLPRWSNIGVQTSLSPSRYTPVHTHTEQNVGAVPTFPSSHHHGSTSKGWSELKLWCALRASSRLASESRSANPWQSMRTCSICAGFVTELTQSLVWTQDLIMNLSQSFQNISLHFP